MKRIIAVLLAVLLLFAGCKKTTPEEELTLETGPELTMSRPATYEGEAPQK